MTTRIRLIIDNYRNALTTTLFWRPPHFASEGSAFFKLSTSSLKLLRSLQVVADRMPPYVINLTKALSLFEPRIDCTTFEFVADPSGSYPDAGDTRPNGFSGFCLAESEAEHFAQGEVGSAGVTDGGSLCLRPSAVQRHDRLHASLHPGHGL